MARITLAGLSKRFDAVTAVDAVDLRIEPGELFFLLGPSGCGKTTIMRMIAGLIEPSAGTIRFDDRDVTALPTARRNTALVFQSYALWPHLTVAQNVAFGLDVRRVPAEEKAERVAATLRTIRMSELADRRPMQLSGGQQQRVALARALVVNPEVLLLDEPLSNLDAKLRLEMRGEIRRLCDETGITTVYVTHDQEEALSIADRIAVLNEGRVEQVGTPGELYGRPRNRFVADFLGRANFIRAEVVGRDGERLRLRGGGVELVSAAFAEDVADGASVTCCVRPEAVRVLDDSQGADNVLTGSHRATTFLGHIAEHVFETADGQRLAAEELKPRERVWADGGTRLGFGAEDLVVLSD